MRFGCVSLVALACVCSFGIFRLDIGLTELFVVVFHSIFFVFLKKFQIDQLVVWIRCNWFQIVYVVSGCKLLDDVLFIFGCEGFRQTWLRNGVGQVWSCRGVAS